MLSCEAQREKMTPNLYLTAHFLTGCTETVMAESHWMQAILMLRATTVLSSAAGVLAMFLKM